MCCDGYTGVFKEGEGVPGRPGLRPSIANEFTWPLVHPQARCPTGWSWFLLISWGAGGVSPLSEQVKRGQGAAPKGVHSSMELVGGDRFWRLALACLAPAFVSNSGEINRD